MWPRTRTVGLRLTCNCRSTKEPSATNAAAMIVIPCIRNIRFSVWYIITSHYCQPDQGQMLMLLTANEMNVIHSSNAGACIYSTRWQGFIYTHPRGCVCTPTFEVTHPQWKKRKHTPGGVCWTWSKIKIHFLHDRVFTFKLLRPYLVQRLNSSSVLHQCRVVYLLGLY
jgi:hypothetical protein